MTLEELEALVKQLQTEVNTLKDSVATLTNQIESISRMNGLLDFDLNDKSSPLTNGDILQYDNGKWYNIQPSKLGISGTGDGISPTSLGGLTDVLLTTPSNGQILTYSSSYGKWINKDAEKTQQVDLSKYLTITDAAKIYFPIAGGEITGPTTILSTLHTTGNITSEQAITAKAIA